MNNKKLLYGIIGLIVLVLVVATGVYVYQQLSDDSSDSSQGTSSESTGPGQDDENSEDEVDANSYRSDKGVNITVSTPARGGKVSSPLTVSGEVPGSWSHEAQFTVRLLDSNSSILAEEAATLDGDWMTEDMVEFSVSLSFEAPDEGTGLLILEKANPSDLEENADSLAIPITF